MVWLSISHEDCVPEHSPSRKSRATPSKYKMMLELVV